MGLFMLYAFAYKYIVKFSIYTLVRTCIFGNIARSIYDVVIDISTTLFVKDIVVYACT